MMSPPGGASWQDGHAARRIDREPFERTKVARRLLEMLLSNSNTFLYLPLQ